MFAMETTDQTYRPDLALLRTKRSKQVLKHILSPLEEAAMRRNYQPFTYNLDGARAYISASMCRHLVRATTQKVELLRLAIEKDELAKNIPYKLREVFDDPRIILSLPPRLRNTLCRLECYTLFTLIQKGRSYFVDGQKFSAHAM